MFVAPVKESVALQVIEVDCEPFINASEGAPAFTTGPVESFVTTKSIDPVAEVADVCARHDTWLHVDAAYGGAAGVVPEMRHVLEGIALTGIKG